MVVVQSLGQGWGVQPQQLQQLKQPQQPQLAQAQTAATRGVPTPTPVGVVIKTTKLPPSTTPSTGAPRTAATGTLIFSASGRVAAAGSIPAAASQEQQFVFAVPGRKQVAAAAPPSAMVEWRNTFNVRPVLLSALRSRRNGLRQGHGGHGHGGLGGAGPRGGSTTTRFGAARSLDLLRTNLQSAINKDIKQVLNKYMERFFRPAMDNIRVNMAMGRGCEMVGSEVLLEEQVRAVLQRALEEAKLMYSRPVAATAPLQQPQQHQQQHQQHQQQQQQQQGRRQRKRSRCRAASAPTPEQAKQPALPAVTAAPVVSGASPPRAAAPSVPSTPTTPIAVPVVKFHNGVLTHSSRAAAAAGLAIGGIGGDKSPPPATLQQMFKKRKEMDAEAETRRKKARLATILVTSGAVAPAGASSAMSSGAGAVTILTVPQGRPNSPRASPSPSLSPSPRPSPRPSPSASPAIAAPPKQSSAGMGAMGAPATPTTPLGHVHINYQSPKWDPARITADTLFVVGARANKVLGYESSRGRMYNRHQDLFKYASDHEDKEWLAKNQLIQPSGGKTFLCVMQDIHELAVSQEYKNNPNVNLLELKGFRAPDFLLKKIRAYMRNLRMEPLDDLSGLLDMDLLQEDGVANMDDSSLMELALEYGVTLMSDDTSSPTSSPAAATSPVSPAACTTPVATAPVIPANTADSSPTPPSTTVVSTDTTSTSTPTTRASVLSTGAMLATLPPSLEALAPLPVAAAIATTTAAAAVITAAPAATTAATAAASSTPASPAERVKGLIRSQSLPVAPFMMESLALEELEMYIKSHSVDVEDAVEAGETDGALDASLEASLEANLDASLDLNLDVNLDVGSAEHNQLELAWDFIGELSSPPHSPGSSPSPQDVDDQDEQAEDFPAEAATPAEAALAAPAVPASTPASEALPAPVLVQTPESLPAMAAGGADGGGGGGGGGGRGHDGGGPETSLAMSHATLTALLSGNTLEGLDIPDGLL